MGVSRLSHEEPAGTAVVPTGSLLKGCLACSPLCVAQFTRSRCRTSWRWIRFGLFALGLPRSADFLYLVMPVRVLRLELVALRSWDVYFPS